MAWMVPRPAIAEHQVGGAVSAMRSSRTVAKSTNQSGTKNSRQISEAQQVADVSVTIRSHGSLLL
jgi:hypothetical protein